MATLQCWDYPLQTGKLEGSTQGFIVIDREHLGTLLHCYLRDQRADARVIQASRDRIGLLHLPLGRLDDERTTSVQDTLGTDIDGRGGLSAIHPMTAPFS